MKAFEFVDDCNLMVLRMGICSYNLGFALLLPTPVGPITLRLCRRILCIVSLR